jgi:hypothetical protein
MSQASELLNNTENQRIAASLGPEPHIVVGADRFITVPSVLKRLAVQGDHNIETVIFDCPRYWDDLDLYSMTVYVNYMLADGTPGSFRVENKNLDDIDANIFHFTWTISGNVTKINGKIRFLVCAKNVNEYGEIVNHWNSELNEEAYISKGLECTDVVAEMQPDIITQILARLDSIPTNLVTSINAFYITITDKGDSDYQLDKTISDIVAAHDNGKTLLAVYNKDVYQLKRWACGQIEGAPTGAIDFDIRFSSITATRDSNIYIHVESRTFTIIGNAYQGNEEVSIDTITVTDNFLTDDYMTIVDSDINTLHSRIDSAKVPSKLSELENDSGFITTADWEEFVEYDHIPETTRSFYPDAAAEDEYGWSLRTYTEIVEGGTYTITFDGTTYARNLIFKTVSKTNGRTNNFHYIGNLKIITDYYATAFGMQFIDVEDTGEPFCIQVAWNTSEGNTWMWYVTTGDSEEHTIRVTGPRRVVHTIPSQYRYDMIEEFVYSNSVPSPAVVGEPCTMNIYGLSKCNDGDPIMGLVLSEFVKFGDTRMAMVQTGGYITLPFSSAIENVFMGYHHLSSDGNGGVKLDDSGREYFVKYRNTTDKTITFRL